MLVYTFNTLHEAHSFLLTEQAFVNALVLSCHEFDRYSGTVQNNAIKYKATIYYITTSPPLKRSISLLFFHYIQSKMLGKAP